MKFGQLNLESAEDDPLRAVISVSPDYQDTIMTAQLSIPEKFTSYQAAQKQSNIKLLIGERFLIVKNRKPVEAIPCFIYLTPQSGISAQFSVTNFRVIHK